MFYLSQLLGAGVENQQHERVGKVIDVLAATTLTGKSVYADAVLIEGEEGLQWQAPPTSLQRQDSLLHLTVPIEQLPAAQPDLWDDNEVRLAQEVLDKQVIDIAQKKAVRVNDICIDEDWRILGIDTSPFGLIRRLAPAWLLGARGRAAPTNLVNWDHIELIGTQEHEVPSATALTMASQQRGYSGNLADLHPADLAEIVHQLTPSQGASLIASLDDETAADAMEEIDTERQRHILENIEPERAADILQVMEPDEAADLIAKLPEERARQLLQLMTPEESEDVQELLEYKEDSAGGMMTTDYIVLNQNRTVAEALDAIRTDIKENDVRMAYIYCVEDEARDENRVLGVVSLWELLVAAPQQMLQELMETDIISVRADSDARSVAEKMAKYNLLAIPVVNEDGFLEGVITVDDALDVLLPPESRRKPKRMY